MTKIVVFDSGLGSLSVITPIRKRIKADIIYFADQKNYPYGTKTISQLDKIIKSTIIQLQEKFEPDIIVVGSNTPSLLLDIEKKKKSIGVFPPLKEAVSKTKTRQVGILAKSSVVKSRSLPLSDRRIAECAVVRYRSRQPALADPGHQERQTTH